MEFLFEYGLFFAKIATVVIAIVGVLVLAKALNGRHGSQKGELEVINLTEQYKETVEQLESHLFDKALLKARDKADKKSDKEHDKARQNEIKQAVKNGNLTTTREPRLFVIDFHGSIDAREVSSLRQEISAILAIAIEGDEVIAAGVYPSPVPFAHVVTTTTHKTLAGPRGGLIISACGDEDIYKKLNSAVFPGGQGGPLCHVIAAKAVAFKEALQPEFKTYQAQVVKNAQAMVAVLQERGYKVVSGKTDNHLFLLDLIDKDITGKDADAALGNANITVNKNSVPNDPRSPFVTSGLRIGSPAITRRGFKEAESKELAGWICDVLDNIEDESVQAQVKEKVKAICAKLPVYA